MAQEVNIHSLFASKQTAKGSPSIAGTKRFILPGGGDIQTRLARASVPFSDLEKYGDAYDFLDSMVGEGDPVIAGTVEEVAYLLWLFTGGETVTNVTGPPAKKRHTYVPTTGFFWSSWHIRKGLVDQLQRFLFADTRISQLVFAASFGQKDLRVTPTLRSLDPGQVKAADPVKALPTKDPVLHTDGTGRFKINTTVFEGLTGYTLTLNEDLQYEPGDDVMYIGLRPGNVGATISVNCYLDSDGIALYNQEVYGTATPAADAKPLKTIPALGSFEAHHKVRNPDGSLQGDEFHPTMAGVRWQIPDLPPPNPQGGAAELTLTGEMRKVPATPAWQIDVDCDDVAFTT